MGCVVVVVVDGAIVCGRSVALVYVMHLLSLDFSFDLSRQLLLQFSFFSHRMRGSTKMWDARW